MWLRSARKKGDDLIDYISKMPDDVLVSILSRLAVKGAVVTGSLSKRWRHLWRNLFWLNFDGTETLNKMANDETLCDLESGKFIKQVNNVISSLNLPMVQVFQIRFDLDCSYSKCIDEWIQFALDKKVQCLELNLLDKNNRVRDPVENYNFMLPSLNTMSLTLKVLVLRSVNLNEPTLNVILNSPHLEALSMFGSVLFPHIRVGGRDSNLKNFQLLACVGIESISVYDFDLQFFQYRGRKIELHLTDLPKLKKLGIGEVSVGLENSVFRHISSSCASCLEVLMLEVRFPEKNLDVNAILKFPNVKYLTLAIGVEEDNSLLEFTSSIAQACPRLETLFISLLWLSPLKRRRRKVRRVVAPEGHKHLKLMEINGYYGRISDLELAVYAIDNAVALKDIVIDPSSCQACGITTYDKLKREKAARSAAKRQLTPLLPPGVNLAIL